ncbi:MAG: S41 family peptidase [Planctomycetota bacterium]
MIQQLKAEYSFTELKRIDWDRLVRSHAPAPDAMSDATSFCEAVRPLLSKLNDIHVWMELPGGDRVHTSSSSFRSNVDESIMRGEVSDLEVFEGIGWTARSGDLGVIVVKTLPSRANFGPMIASIQAMRDCNGVVVDLRRNSGGSENKAAQIASLFAANRTKYARNLVRRDGRMVESEPRFIEPSANGFAKSQGAGTALGAGASGRRTLSELPVVCLIGPGCVSSGEGFALMMKSLPNVSVIGQPTRGASGNPRPVTLSNGVRVWFSRWISLELDGTAIEGVGVQPEEWIEHAAGSDRAFDVALDRLRS